MRGRAPADWRAAAGRLIKGKRHAHRKILHSGLSDGTYRLKPSAFQYRRASTLEEAYGLLSHYGEDAKVVAGGQSLVPMMNLRLVSPAVLVDIGGIESLRRVSCADGVLRIGALVRHRQVETDELIAEHAPLLAKAVHHVAHLAVRNRGTFGGSVCHADPAAEFPACCLLLEAVMEIGSARGVREVRADDFFHGPFTTSVEADELLLAVRIPAWAAGTDFAFHELSRRQGDFALSGVAARAAFANTVWTTRWVAFGVSDRPVVLTAVENLFAQQALENVTDQAIKVVVDSDLTAEDSDTDRVALQKLLTAELVRRCISDLQSASRRSAN
jgi:carbon-monoxide dehydrogenase medium subunit